MILYFTGTGNSEYVAKRIGKSVKDEALGLFFKIKEQDHSPLHSSRPWVVVTPTYAWRIPRLLEAWLEKTRLSGSKDIYFVMTCGGNIGNAGKYLQKLCEKKGMDYRGCQAVVMPENYIALFATPKKEEALQILDRAETAIAAAIDRIKMEEAFEMPKITAVDRLLSGIVNMAFYPLFVHAKKFKVTDACISCGLCEKVCPLKNVTIENGRPVWGDQCTHCMACICRCPKEAIEYGRHSRGLPRYTCPK